MIRKNSSSLARLAMSLAGTTLLLAPLLARQSSGHSLRFAVASARADESPTAPSLSVEAARPAAAGSAAITIDYPQDGSIFPPDILPPTFIWRDVEASAKTWRIDITFADASNPIHVTSHGEPIQIGKIDPRCVSENNKPPALTPEQAAAHTWIPDAGAWAIIKQHSVEHPATIEITGVTDSAPDSGRLRRSHHPNHLKRPRGRADFLSRCSADADRRRQRILFSRLAPSSYPLINWRLRDIGQPESRIAHARHAYLRQLPLVLRRRQDDGHGRGRPGQRQGPVRRRSRSSKHMSIRNQDMVPWNHAIGALGKSRVGFMSQVSPDGQYVLTTFAGAPDEFPVPTT